MKLCLVLSALLLAGCGVRERPVVADSTEAATPVLPDSLALRTSAGIEVWLVQGRSATSADGAPCHERSLEIREGKRRRRIPLLYTGDTPIMVNDSTIEARLWLHCVPGSRHQVSLGTGQPVRVP